VDQLADERTIGGFDRAVDDLLGRLDKRAGILVGISKAVLLASNGQIGPALDSQVRDQLRIRAPVSSGEWLHILDDVGADIRAFEAQHGLL
jgi:hypothetical protein